MDSQPIESPLLFLLEQLDADSAGIIVGRGDFSETGLKDMLYLRVLTEMKPADKVLCYHACEMDCDLVVVRRGKEVHLACPRGQVGQERISTDEIRRFHVDITHFARQLCSANGISCVFDKAISFADGVYPLGRKDIAAETVEFILSTGLRNETDYTTLLNLRTHIREGRVIALSPTSKIVDVRQLNHLHAEYIYPMTIADLLEYPDKLVLDSNTIHKAIVPQLEDEKAYTLFIDTRKRIILYKNHSVTLKPKAYEFLLHLARHPGDVITRNEIYNMLWPQPMNENEQGVIVNDSQIDDHADNIRGPFKKLCGSDTGITPGEISALIETLKKVGFRLNIPQTEIRLI
jgi:DNA-binding winged helix-turn-helix (wHTH) protein